MIRVYISPDYDRSKPQQDNGGIRRVVEAELDHLGKFDIQIVHNPGEANIIQNHGASQVFVPGIPIVHTGHGLYWSRQPWGEGHQEVNAEVVKAMQMAVAHTVPSEWVNRAVRRGGLWYPEVVYHGVDAETFTPGTNQNYVLSNKARADYVSDPNDLMRVSQLLPSVQFRTTVGRDAVNVKLLGVLSHEMMRQTVADAGVYLCTARETFGIGTLEAMACGVPVAGWDWGGQQEIIIPGVTGYLAPPGDFPALAECIQKCMNERERLGANARQDAIARWGWEPRIQQYAEIFKRIHKSHSAPHPKVSLVITTYKLDQYLPACLDSVSKQTFEDFECLVVDDVPADSTKIIVAKYTEKDKRIRYCPVLSNLGLPGARNYGLHLSRGAYIRHLDADDWLAENALALEAEFLDKNPAFHIAYGHLEVVNPDGSRIVDRQGFVERSSWPSEQFDWLMQMAHLNQLPSCVMMRREVQERVGGYRTRAKRNEDADFWCRTTSLGFRAAKFTQAVTYFHRNRPDSKGSVEWKDEGAERDWTAWFPWRVGSASFSEARDVLRKIGGSHPVSHLVPFGAQGKPATRKFWYVHDYAYPVVSVIVTCGPGHKPYLIDALDSLQAQSYPDWECIVVNDTGEKWDPDILGAPWTKVINMDGNQGASAARNAGFPHTRGKFIVWMDADDYWMPWFLDRMVVFAENNDGVIFSDLIQEKEGKFEIYRYEEFDQSRVALSMRYPGSSVLTPRKIVQAVLDKQGGWDREIQGMEDWDFQIAVHDLGFCAYHIPEPLFVYRLNTSTKREKDYARIEEIREFMDVKWKKYRKDGIKMGCGCQPKKNPKNRSGSTLSSSGDFPQSSGIAQEGAGEQMVNLEYVGPMEQTFSIRSRVDPGITYRFGNNPSHRIRTVFLEDAEYLIAQRNGQDLAFYRVVSLGQGQDENNPANFIGQPIVSSLPVAP